MDLHSMDNSELVNMLIDAEREGDNKLYEAVFLILLNRGFFLGGYGDNMSTYEKQLFIEFETKLEEIQYYMHCYQASGDDIPKDVVSEWNRIFNIALTLQKELKCEN
jgi:hypothetical protein